MDIYLSHLDCQTKYTNEKRMWIFKEVIDTYLTDLKIVKFSKPYFKVSMALVDNKRINVFQMSNIILKAKDS
jgi:uncharacterized Fe-S radical SAM superfamily protein PflX